MPEKKLIPAIVQDALNGRVLMLGYMDDEALEKTRETGEVHFWSRSRQRLWKKGETSGNVLRLVEIKEDCDHDTFLVRALPHGPTCHTGSISCFGAEPSPHEFESLFNTILERKSAPEGTRSYTKTLLQDSRNVVEKILEEAGELSVEIMRGPRERVISEAADLIFHILVGLAQKDVTLDDVAAELRRRSGTSGLDEKAARKT
jgi:phosphoribosyl-ATP pyrophosphohydrolase/phosphoribosyl-AMP cyclohydrolase